MTDIRARAPTVERLAPAMALGAMLMFSIQDLATKLVSDSVSIWQMQFVRSLFVVTFVATAAVLIAGAGNLRPSRFGWPMLRSGFMILSYLFFYGSLPHLTLSAAAAALFTGPLFISVLAWLVLGERLGPRRVVAIVVGLIGVVVIVRPGSDAMQPAALLPVAAAACYALGIIVTRARCRDEPVLGLTLLHNLLYAAVGAIGMLAVSLLPIGAGLREQWPFFATGWRPIEGWVLAILAATAITHVVGVVAITRAYQTSETSRIAPLEYSYLLYAPLWDVAFWGRAPDGATIGGMALIAAAGGFVAWREGRPARPTMPSDGEESWDRKDAA